MDGEVLHEWRRPYIICWAQRLAPSEFDTAFLTPGKPASKQRAGLRSRSARAAS